MGLGVEKLIPREILDFFRYSAITGFAATVAILINFNHDILKKIFGENVSTFWWTFLLISLMVLFLALFMFTVLFEGSNFDVYRYIILKLLGRG